MKKNIIIILSIITLIIVSLVIGCKKEATDADYSLEGPLKSQKITELERLYNQLQIPDFGNIRLVNGDILKFVSEEHYDQVYESLNNLYEAWTALFLQTYDTGDEEELDATIERLGFDDNLPLFKFVEKYKMAHPLIWEATQKEEGWLERGGNGSPPEDEITSCPIEQTLLSKYHEYCIGDTICQLRPNGSEIHIPTSKLNMLTQIRNASIEELMSFSKEPPHGGGSGGGPLYIPEPFNVNIYPPNGNSGGSGGDCGCDFCYCTEYKNDFESLHGAGYKFTLSYNFRYDFYKKNAKTTVTVKNYKLKNNDWKKDYGSQCRLGFSTKLHQNPKIDQCIDKGYDGKTGNITKAYSKSKGKKFNFDYKIVTDNINNSYITYRHQGVEYKFNPRGEIVP